MPVRGSTLGPAHAECSTRDDGRRPTSSNSAATFGRNAPESWLHRDRAAALSKPLFPVAIAIARQGARLDSCGARPSEVACFVDCRRGFARSGDAGSPVTRARWCERDLLLRHRSHHRVGSAAHRFGSIGGSERRSVLGVDVRDGRDDVTGDTGIFRTPASIQVSLGGGDQRRRAVDPEWSGHDARQAHSCAGACIVFGRRAHGAVKILRSRQQLPWGLMCVLSARWPMEICSANARR